MSHAFTPDTLSQLKRRDLINLCKSHNIKAIGKNSEMIERLLMVKRDTENDAQEVETNEILILNELSEEKLRETSCLDNFEGIEDLKEFDNDHENFESTLLEESDKSHGKHEPIQIATNYNQVLPNLKLVEMLSKTPISVVKDILNSAKKTGLHASPIRVPFSSLAKLKSGPAVNRETLNENDNNNNNICNAEQVKQGSFIDRLTGSKNESSKIPRLFKKTIDLAEQGGNSSSKTLLPSGMIKLLEEQKKRRGDIQCQGKDLETMNVSIVNESKSETKCTKKFDLKESLKRPLSYKPYTGPIHKSGSMTK